MALHRITPCLWLDTQAEEAANYYCSIFPNSSIGKIARFGEGGHGEPGTVMVVEFQLDGQSFMGLNGGPAFNFTEAVSFVVHCATQEELDHYWEKLTAGGSEVQCGWLRDRFGLSWQIVPAELSKLLDGSDPVKSRRAMQSMLGMKKLDIHALQAAYDGR